ncbi:MAG: 2,3,4,5-tetrahydropyridine-2,6-dicarboxylate N-succinyltransferase [Bdellovibrionales bacterium]|nr:2,3,4,5-tetrahydropyridine-2,6-dicarboxylate N-succinyltransferase [Bdellovibrionales bacterium]
MQIKTPVEVERVKTTIEDIYAKIESGELISDLTEKEVDTVYETLGYLDRGHIRVAEKVNGVWKVNDWAKKAILLYFRLQEINVISAGEISFVDKIPTKKWLGQEQVRVVPPAVVRFGAFVGSQCILMPSFVNIGAYVDKGTMVDTWATVGSCAQIGANVHLAGGVGIGGVLEPLQSSPVIIEDHVFVGSRCVVVEGVLVEEGAVLGAGVILTSSTKIVDVTGNTPKITTGRVPKNAVVIPGVVTKEFPAGPMGTPCAMVIGKRTESTDKKTSLNQVLRDFGVSV